MAAAPDRTPLNVVRGCVVASVAADSSRRSLEGLRAQVLERMRTSGARRVVLDLSAVAVMDSDDFAAVCGMVAAARLMGARTVLAGMQPGVVAALVELGARAEGLQAALDVDDALAALEQPPPRQVARRARGTPRP